MGCDAVEHKGELHAFVPAYRADVLHPVDLVEDIGIAYGFNRLKPVLPNVATIGKIDSTEKLCSKAREVMVGLGFQEVIRTVLTNPEDQFDRMCISRQKVVELENPVSKQYVCMRAWILPSLLEVLAANKHVEYPQKIFEVGDVVSAGSTPKEVRKIGGAISDSKVGFADCKAVVNAFLKAMGIEHVYKSSSHPSFIPGRVAEIVSGSRTIGLFGEVHPKVLENWHIEMPTVAFEIELSS
jgi:phenylalanyl-tRNA synthetase beta chain